MATDLNMRQISKITHLRTLFKPNMASFKFRKIRGNPAFQYRAMLLLIKVRFSSWPCLPETAAQELLRNILTIEFPQGLPCSLRNSRKKIKSKYPPLSQLMAFSRLLAVSLSTFLGLKRCHLPRPAMNNKKQLDRDQFGPLQHFRFWLRMSLSKVAVLL